MQKKFVKRVDFAHLRIYNYLRMRLKRTDKAQ